MTSGTCRRKAASSKQASSWASDRRWATAGSTARRSRRRRALVGRPERRALDDGVGVLARHPALVDQGDEHAGRGVEPEPAGDVLAHPLGADQQAVDQPGHPDEHVVEQDRRVGQDDPLRARVADVALVPERLVLERRVRVPAQQTGEPGDPLGEDRVALVGHRATSPSGRP